jgi:hypothetical protein
LEPPPPVPASPPPLLAPLLPPLLPPLPLPPLPLPLLVPKLQTPASTHASESGYVAPPSKHTPRFEQSDPNGLYGGLASTSVLVQ